jgi:hypothetical protein
MMLLGAAMTLPLQEPTRAQPQRVSTDKHNDGRHVMQGGTGERLR